MVVMKSDNLHLQSLYISYSGKIWLALNLANPPTDHTASFKFGNDQSDRIRVMQYRNIWWF